MSLFADCRKKFTRDAYPYGTQFRKREDIPKDEVSPYWDGRLKGRDKAYVQGYDDCAEDNIKGFFDNYLVYEYELDNAFGTHLLRKVDESVLSDEREASEFSEQERESWTPETKILKTLKDCMLDYYEMSRNENVTAIIDGGDYDDEAEEKQDAAEKEKKEETS